MGSDDDTEALGATLEATSQATLRLGQDLDALRASFVDTSREGSVFAKDLKTGLSRAFRDVVVEGDSLSDSLSKLARSLADKALDSALSPVADAVGNGIGGFISSILPFQAGGVIQSGNIQAFASGGIINSPTYFPMRGATGLVGEAGPEAIVPLKRGADGKLGIAGGGRPQSINVNFNITTNDARSFTKSQAQIGARLRQVIAHSARS